MAKYTDVTVLDRSGQKILEGSFCSLDDSLTKAVVTGGYATGRPFVLLDTYNLKNINEGLDLLGKLTAGDSVTGQYAFDIV